MDEMPKDLDFLKSRDLRFVGRSSDAPVPRYYLYGDSGEDADEWFVNAEPLDQRARSSDWSIAPHAHPRFGQLILVREGGGAMSCDGGLHRFTSPALLIVPVQCIHGFDYAPDTEGIVLTVAAPYLADLARRAPDLACIWSQPGPIACRAVDLELDDITASLQRLDRELDDAAAGSVIAAEACLLSILVSTLRLQVRNARDTTLAGDRRPASLTDRFFSEIETHFRNGWSVADYANALCVSEAQLRAATTLATGEAPLKLIHDRVLTEARRNLVYSGRSVSQIAYDLGFADPAYFTRFFTTRTGYSPARYRREMALAPHAV